MYGESSSTMTNIIPGAAYLSERAVLNGVDPEKNYGFHLARIEGGTLVYVSPAPSDLVLLYAPGDKVSVDPKNPEFVVIRHLEDWESRNGVR